MPQQFNVPFRLRGTATAIFVAACFGVCAAPVVCAQSTAVEIHLPAQELAAALDALALQTGIRLLYSPEALKGKRAPAIDGKLAVGEALNRLLAGSGLEWSMNGGAYAIKPAVTGGPSSAKELAPITITATRTERRIDEVPASVSVITAQDIRSQQALKVGDLLSNVEGIDVIPDANGAGTLIMRGLGGSFAGRNTQLLVDGMSVQPQAVSLNGDPALEFVDMNDIERVEVLRGPASSLYGPSAMGGVINILTKRWTGQPGGNVEIGLGSHDALLKRASAGAGSDKFDLRVSASDFRTDGYVAQPKAYAWGQKDLAGRDLSDRKASVQLGFYPTAGQEITFGMRDYTLDFAWVGGRPNYRQERNGTLYDLGYKLDLGSVGDVKVKYVSARIRDTLKQDGLFADPTDFALYTIDKRAGSADSLEIQGNFRLTPGNLLTVGVAHSTGKEIESWTTDVPENSPMDLAWYGFGFDYHERGRMTEESTMIGLYVQDEVRVSENLLFNVGARQDHFRLHDSTSYYWDNTGTETYLRRPDSKANAFTPRAGVRYRMTEKTSVYASYGEAYVPVTNILRYRSNSACNNPNLKPERSASTEIGLNHEWAGFFGRLAVFHTDYQDKIESDYAFCGRAHYTNVSAVAAEGLEFSIEDRSASVWRPYLNYAYTDSKIERNPLDRPTEGKRMTNVSTHKLNLGVVYSPSPDWTARFSGRYVGDRYADLANSRTGRIPGYFVADLKISKRLPVGPLAREAELSLAVNNLFDEEYVTKKGVWAGTENWREYGDGLTWWLSLSAKF